ncbi:MAG: DUF6580 family putative transport protein, partial [Caldisericaceae bacterium]
TDFIKSGTPQSWELIVIAGWITAGLTQRVFAGKSLAKIFSMEILGTIAFFLVTNSLVFVLFNFYPKALVGYFDCLAAGLPFLRNQLLGNTFFSLIAFATVKILSGSPLNAQDNSKEQLQK